MCQHSMVAYWIGRHSGSSSMLQYTTDPTWLILQGWFSKVCDRRLFQIRRKAIAYLKVRYEAHVRKILEIPNIKDGSHDITLQHLQALKDMGHEPCGFFIHVEARFEYSVRQISLTEFINLRAQPSEATVSDPAKKSQEWYITDLLPHLLRVLGSCVVCKSERHPLFVC